jgi:UV DNA damage repair endonuclease
MSKDRFFKVYSNLPEGVRKEVILVIDEKPYSWDAVFVEVVNDTALGNRMVEKLTKMELI